MAKWQYTKGLHDLGNGCWAWLQPDGSWGYSNAGLVADGGETLLVDTLFDLAHTREMLDAYRRVLRPGCRFGSLVNTHSNGDHTYGNQLVEGARIIASRACAEEMAERRPEERREMLRTWQNHGELGRWLHRLYGPRFDFDGVVYTPPTEVFEGELTVRVGGKEVRLVQVGPAHTRGDVLAYVPADRTVYTGDILFIEGHPVVWAGPIGNWTKACDLILGWDVETIVPGHGPIVDKAGVRAFRAYLEFLKAEARRRYDAGMSAEQAAGDISFAAYPGWLDPERVHINVHSLYREFSGKPSPMDPDRLYGLMARYRWKDAPEGGA